jgi:hypothetical protein
MMDALYNMHHLSTDQRVRIAREPSSGVRHGALFRRLQQMFSIGMVAMIVAITGEAQEKNIIQTRNEFHSSSCWLYNG